MRRALLASLAALTLAASASAQVASFPAAPVAGTVFRAGVGTALNMNVTTDQAITLTGPASGNWTVIREVWDNCSANSSVAAGAVYGAAAKAGGIILGSITTAGPSIVTTGAKVYTMQINIASSVYAPVYSSSSQTVYFSLTTAEGSAATCDVYIYGETL